MAAMSQVARARAHVIGELRAGLRPPGAPIVVKDVATSLRLSPTPVREALALLAGEGLVALLDDRNGFAVPRLGAGDLVESLDLLRTLLVAALSVGRPASAPPVLSSAQDAGPMRRIEMVIDWMIEGCGNGQLTLLIRRLGVTLAPYRQREPDVIPLWASDLQRLVDGIVAGDSRALQSYLQKRVELAPRIIDVVDRQTRHANIFQI